VPATAPVNFIKTKINTNEINTRLPNGPFTVFFILFFCQMPKKEIKSQNVNLTQLWGAPQLRRRQIFFHLAPFIYLFMCIFNVFFFFLKLSSICACNKLLLIEAQTGQTARKQMKTGISKPNQWQMAKTQNGRC